MRFSLPQTRIAARLFFGFGSLMLLIAAISGFSIYASNSSTIAFADVMRGPDQPPADQLRQLLLQTDFFLDIKMRRRAEFNTADLMQVFGGVDVISRNAQ